MENEDYTVMFYKDLIKYNLKRTQHKIFIEDLSILLDHNPFDMENIIGVCDDKSITRHSLYTDLLTKISTNIFMGLHRSFDEYYCLDLIASCLGTREGIEDLSSNISDDIINISFIISDYMDKYRIYSDHVALDKIIMGDNMRKILGTFVVFEKGIIYE